MRLLTIALLSGMSLLAEDPKPKAPTTPPKEKDKRLQILEADGIKDIQFTGYPFFVCSDSDSVFFNTGFKGVKNGIPVKGALCGG